MLGAPFVALIGEGLALVVQLAYAALMRGHVHLFSTFGVVFRLLVKVLLAVRRTEDISLALVAAPELGLFVDFHLTYGVFHAITIKLIRLSATFLLYSDGIARFQLRHPCNHNHDLSAR